MTSLLMTAFSFSKDVHLPVHPVSTICDTHTLNTSRWHTQPTQDGGALKLLLEPGVTSETRAPNTQAQSWACVVWAPGLCPGKGATHQRRAILMGVVRQDVNRSAGRSGIMGRSSVASHAASWMQFFIDGGSGIWASGWLGLMAATCREH